jgi:hypothetical protein
MHEQGINCEWIRNNKVRKPKEEGNWRETDIKERER